MKTEQQNLIDKATIRYIGETVRKLWGNTKRIERLYAPMQDC